MNQIAIKDISFAYQDNTIFESFSLTIQEGEFVAIVGANGSGKTTLLRLISGILQPAKGTITIDDKAVSDNYADRLEVARNYLSVVLQNPEDQFVGSTVEEDIAFGLENKCIPREEIATIIAEVTKTMRLEKLLTKEPVQLSGGQKQRVAIASALAMKTKYLFFDEATSQLDPQGKKEVMTAIRELAETEQKTIIMITHDLEEILYATRVVVLKDGVIVADTTPERLFIDFEAELAAFHLALPPIVTYAKRLYNAGLIKHLAFSADELVGEVCE